MKEEERWIMMGLPEDDPSCIKSAKDLSDYINEIGFLPLFRGDIPGFSVEEHTASDHWFCDDPEKDPWEWRKVIAREGQIAYGKFFGGRAGFISKKWFPAFANFRRDGYDFDSRWDDELASVRSKKIMDLYAEDQADRELYSFEVKKLAGFGDGGEKNFEGEITRLQMQTYLCVRDFRRRKNKNGNEYGWGIAVYCLPEHIWGYDYVTSEYKDDPKDSALKIIRRIRELNLDAEDEHIVKVLGKNEHMPAAGKKDLPFPQNLAKALKIEELNAEDMTLDQMAGLIAAVGQLRDKQRKTILLKYEERKNNEEIAQILNRAPGTIGSYHTKGVGKLRWKSIRPWYMDGYEKTLKAYLEKKGCEYRPRPTDADVVLCSEDYCQRLGIGLKLFDALYSAGIKTISDLLQAASDPLWYRNIKGIGPKSAEDILDRLSKMYAKS